MRRIVLALAVATLGFGSAVAADRASSQRQALWVKMAMVPDLKEVDQVIIEGDGSGPIVRGWVERRNWMSVAPTYYFKPFTAKFERICSAEIPECYGVKGIWSRGELISGSD